MLDLMETQTIQNILKDFPKILIIEGPDAVGKSTLVRQIKDHFEQKGKDLRVIAYPGNRDDVRFRDILLNSDAQNYPEHHVFVFLADFVFTFEKYVYPYLDNPDVLFIFDRYIPSTCVYQDLTMQFLNSILSHEKFTKFFNGMSKSKYLYLIPENTQNHLKRLSMKKGDEINHFDPKSLDEVKLNVQKYTEIAQLHLHTKPIGSDNVTVLAV